MSKILYIALSVALLTLTFCHKSEEVVPDISTDYTVTFQVRIFANSGETSYKVIDVKTSEKYSDFKGITDEFKMEKVTYQIKNLNAPDDLYYNGTLICSNEENSESYVTGSIAIANLSELAGQGIENELTLDNDSVNKILAWLITPGRFALKTNYFFRNANGSPYLINGTNAGSNFELVIKFYVLVKTMDT